MHVSFTGTQRGLTYNQVDVLHGLLSRFKDCTLHHGDCVGADRQAHEIAQRLDFDIVVHPCDIEHKRAFCEGAVKTHAVLPPLERNRIIVDDGDVLIACPRDFTEEQRSGTWATVRYARRQGYRVIIIWPNGSIKHEN